MKAEDYVTKWCDETYKGGKELGDWTTAEIAVDTITEPAISSNGVLEYKALVDDTVAKACIVDRVTGKVVEWWV